MKLPNGLIHAVEGLWRRAIAFWAPSQGQGPNTGSKAVQRDDLSPAASPSWMATVERIESARQGPAQPVSGPGVTSSAPRQPTFTTTQAAGSSAQALVTRCAKLANLDPATLVPIAREIEVLIKAGAGKQLDALLRLHCPKERWPWPQADEVFEQAGSKGTRLQQVGLLTSMLLRRFMWASRVKQLHQISHSRPYWQLRTAGGSKTPASCLAEDGRIECHTHDFWTAHGPWSCTRPDCRCSVRTYSRQELIEKGLPVPDL